MAVKADGQRRDLTQLLAYPEVTLEVLATLWPDINAWSPAVREQIEIDAAYAELAVRALHSAYGLDAV